MRDTLACRKAQATEASTEGQGSPHDYTKIAIQSLFTTRISVGQGSFKFLGTFSPKSGRSGPQLGLLTGLTLPVPCQALLII